MLLIGSCIIFFIIFIISFGVANDSISMILLPILLIVSIGMIVYDITSPSVVVSSTTIVTNDYAKYELNVASDKIGIVRVIEQVPSRKLVISGNQTEYEFVEFLE